ncbi:polyprenyl synthetase family protein [Streptomyces sp. Je 1-369]|uniref:polyprenyl synthetase family protein n=1 Tax=Streptomyces sp. Je 1-369 TaxID=2966192 RepID=UPI002285CA03|nr:polyprenyl synthetase family protein [Streptomyces sp. Je 1-369]WAL99824.1 polyprenyl synthetase family protein [Streptomyces sp. Je 1-369]
MLDPHEQLCSQQQAEKNIRAVFPEVRQYLAGVLDTYSPHHESLHSALDVLLTQGRPTPLELSLPLLVHAAISGEARPAVPVAAVHALWWRAANVFDDFVDGDEPPLHGTAPGVAMVAALEGGYGLPLRALQAAPLPGPLRQRLMQDYLDGWTCAIDGQIADVRNHPQEVSTEEVLEVYRNKSASIYEMACTMAARLAHGGQASSPPRPSDSLDPGRLAAPATHTGMSDVHAHQSVTAWGEFGHLLGLLAQFRNDHDDLLDGDREDLRNGTATYLLVHLLNTAPTARERALALLPQAAGSDDKRQELAHMMLTADVVGPYNQFLTSLNSRAHALLDTLAPAPPFTDCLRARVEAETSLLTPTCPA